MPRPAQDSSRRPSTHRPWLRWLVLVVGAYFSAAAVGQFPVVADGYLYDAVIDRVFHYQWRHEKTEILLRMNEYSRPELQIVFRRDDNDLYHIDVWRLPPGAPPIWDQLLTLTKLSQGLTADAAVPKIEVIHDSRVLARTSPLARLFERATALRLPVVDDAELYLHGDYYYLEVMTPSRTLSIRMLGGPQSVAASDPLTRWVRDVVTEVRRELVPETAPPRR